MRTAHIPSLSLHSSESLPQIFWKQNWKKWETKKVKAKTLFTKVKKSLRSGSRSSSGSRALPFARRGLGLLHQRPELRRHLVRALEDRGRVAQHVPGRRLELLRRQRDAAALAVVGQHQHLDLVPGGQDLVDRRDVVVRDLRDVEQAYLMILLLLGKEKEKKGEFFFSLPFVLRPSIREEKEARKASSTTAHR